MYAVEFIPQTRRKHCKLDNYLMKYFAKTYCHQVIKFLTARSLTVICKEFFICDYKLMGFSSFHLRQKTHMSSVHVYVVVQLNLSLVYILFSFVLGYVYV